MHAVTSVEPIELGLEDPTQKVGRWQNNHHNSNIELLATEINETDLDKDHFITRNGVEFAGTHILLDLWGASNLDSLETIEEAMRECVEQCSATLLHIHLHHFTPNGGVSGVAVLAESHISVHTWPEKGYAAFDVFMCGDSMPENAIVVLKRAFNPRKMEVIEELRGRVTGK